MREEGDEEMTDSCISLRCHACGRSFSVEIDRMRLNLSHACPSCGGEYSISGEQALKAHRRLEKFEGRTKSAGAGRVRIDLLLPRALEEAGTEEWPEEGSWWGEAGFGGPWLRGLGKA